MIKCASRWWKKTWISISIKLVIPSIISSVKLAEERRGCLNQKKPVFRVFFSPIRVSVDCRRSCLAMQIRFTSTVLVVNSELYKLYVRGMGGIACLLSSFIEVNYGKTVKESRREKPREDWRSINVKRSINSLTFEFAGGCILTNSINYTADIKMKLWKTPEKYLFPI